METFAHKNSLNLPKVGPVYSEKDEKQRLIAEEILQFRIKPELVLKVNQNIQGLEKKKIIGSINPSTFRLTAKLSHFGKSRVLYNGTIHNFVRFLYAAFGVYGYWYVYADRMDTVYYSQVFNNNETEMLYMKMQTYPSYVRDKRCFMT